VKSGPNVEELRRQAKELLRAAHAGDESALERVRAGGREVNLSAAQNAIAREIGFPDWPMAKRAVESLDKLLNPENHSSPFRPQVSHTMGVVAGDPTSHEDAFLGAVLDEYGNDMEVHLHRGACPHCHARHEFETTTIRGFADFIEAFCPKCKKSLGEFREDVGASISVKLAEPHTKRGSSRDAKKRRGG
jgi:hypothetical protein